MRDPSRAQDAIWNNKQLPLGCFQFLILVVITTLISPSFAQTEEQRKYAIDNQDAIKNFILSSSSTASLSTHFHSKYTYYDIYLDTPNFLLIQNKFSLRFRKRVTQEKKRPITYGFQLKSEMDSLNSLRMEVEETELDFYRVKSGEDWLPLPELLDTLFFHFEHHPDQPLTDNGTQAIALLVDWIQFKAAGAIAPFQKLRFLGIDVEIIKTLRPVSCGYTTRLRSHIYADPDQNEQLALTQNRIKRNDMPAFFSKHPAYNWLLESSLDVAVFYPLYPAKNQIASIIEYEVENKHDLPEVGRSVLDLYEKALLEAFQVVPKMESKYKQGIELFGERR